MKFDIPKKEHPNLERYYKEDIDTAYKFANEIYKELGSLIRAVVVFGSTARRTKQPGGDIDLLVIIDDLIMSMSPEVVEAYRIIVQNSIVRVSTKLHVTTMRFTSFWEYMRNGDPIAINLLRDGVAVDSKEGAHLEGMLEGLISKAVPPADLGKHIYQAEVTDVGGHTARSEEIKLEFEKLEEAKAKGDSYKVVVDTEGEIADTSSDFFTPFYVLMGVLGAVVLGNGLVQLAKSIKAKSAKPSEEESPKEEEA